MQKTKTNGRDRDEIVEASGWESRAGQNVRRLAVCALDEKKKLNSIKSGRVRRELKIMIQLETWRLRRPGEVVWVV